MVLWEHTLLAYKRLGSNFNSEGCYTVLVRTQTLKPAIESRMPSHVVLHITFLARCLWGLTSCPPSREACSLGNTCRLQASPKASCLGEGVLTQSRLYASQLCWHPSNVRFCFTCLNLYVVYLLLGLGDSVFV